MMTFLSQRGVDCQPTLEVYLLGVVDFDACRILQERFLFELSGQSRPHGVLLLCEHPPLITFGREGSHRQFHCEASELIARQLEVRWINRGGGGVVHGPGQIACYPLIPLTQRKLGLGEYIRRLEEGLLATIREQRVPAQLHPESATISCRGGEVAVIGSAVKSGISYHGCFLNVRPVLDQQRLLAPASGTARFSSLAAECMRPIGMHSVRESLVRHLAEGLGYTGYHLYTGHPALRRTRRSYVSAGNR